MSGDIGREIGFAGACRGLASVRQRRGSATAVIAAAAADLMKSLRSIRLLLSRVERLVPPGVSFQREASFAVYRNRTKLANSPGDVARGLSHLIPLVDSS